MHNNLLDYHLLPSLGTSSAFSSDSRQRYISHFGPLNDQVSVANHTLLLFDALSFVEEDYRRIERGLTIQEWASLPGGSYEFVRNLAQGKVSSMESVHPLTYYPLNVQEEQTKHSLRSCSRIYRFIDPHSHSAAASARPAPFDLG